MKKYTGFITALFSASLLIGSLIGVSAASLLSDNFDDGNSSGWTVEKGSWSVVQDNGSYVFYQSSNNESMASNGSAAWNNYSVEAKIKVDNFNSSGNRVYLCGRYKDSKNYYAAAFSNKNGGQLELIKKTSGSSKTLVSKSVSITTGAWYLVKLELNGSTLKMYLNGTLQLTATDTALTAGKVCLMPSKVVAKFDNVAVNSLVTPTPSASASDKVTSTPMVTPSPSPSIDSTVIHLTPYPEVKVTSTIVVKDGGVSLESAVAAAKAGTRILVQGTVKSGPVILPSDIILEGEQGAKLDFSLSGTYAKAIQVPGTNVTIKNLEITKAAYHGIWITGTKNSVVDCYIHHCENTGLHIDEGGENNVIIRVTSAYNFDTKKNGSMADGFGAKEGAGANSWDSCSAIGNSDDGFDFYACHGVQKLYNCTANTSGVADGNGNGFKIGGVDNKTDAGKINPHIDPLVHQLVNCWAEGNKVRGFDRNNNSGAVTMIKCTGKNNGEADFYMPAKTTLNGKVINFEKAIIRDCTSLSGKNNLEGAVLEGKCTGF